MSVQEGPVWCKQHFEDLHKVLLDATQLQPWGNDTAQDGGEQAACARVMSTCTILVTLEEVCAHDHAKGA